MSTNSNQITWDNNQWVDNKCNNNQWQGKCHNSQMVDNKCLNRLTNTLSFSSGVLVISLKLKSVKTNTAIGIINFKFRLINLPIFLMKLL